MIKNIFLLFVIIASLFLIRSEEFVDDSSSKTIDTDTIDIVRNNCTNVVCPMIKCAPGYVSQIKPTSCCPTCVFPCPEILCKPGYTSYTGPDGCKRCKLDCSLVLCALPVCADGQKPIVKENECCPTCPPLNCTLVKCLKPICKITEEPVVPIGKCCPICKPKPCAQIECKVGYIKYFDSNGCAHCKQDCTLVKCIKPLCKSNEIMITPKDKCCPICIKKPCPLILCKPGYTTYIGADGCPKCRQDCSLVKCALPPVCKDGQLPIKNIEECCYKCPKCQE